MRTGPGRTSILKTHNFVRLRRARPHARAYGPKNRGCDHPFYELCTKMFLDAVNCEMLSRFHSLAYYSKENTESFDSVFSLVGEEGLEPSRCCHRQILSLLRLPIPPFAQ